MAQVLMKMKYSYPLDKNPTLMLCKRKKADAALGGDAVTLVQKNSQSAKGWQ
jgi:hypothetical protein